MKANIVFFLFFALVTGAESSVETGAAHPIHVSKFSMRYDVREGGYRTMLYLFFDDLETALLPYTNRAGQNTEIDLLRADSMIRQYVQVHLRVQLEGVLTPFQWVGIEPSDNGHALWVYLFYPSDQRKTIRIEDTIFIEVTEEQKNIVQYYDSSGTLHEEILNGDRTTALFQP